jgi:hypothetical protein
MVARLTPPKSIKRAEPKKPVIERLGMGSTMDELVRKDFTDPDRRDRLAGRMCIGVDGSDVFQVKVLNDYGNHQLVATVKMTEVAGVIEILNRVGRKLAEDILAYERQQKR